MNIFDILIHLLVAGIAAAAFQGRRKGSSCCSSGGCSFCGGSGSCSSCGRNGSCGTLNGCAAGEGSGEAGRTCAKKEGQADPD